MATTKLRIKKTGEPTPKPTLQELAQANQFAKDFATRKGLVIGQDAHVGNALPKFIDAATGQPVVQGQTKLPPNTIMDIRNVPSYVKELQMGDDNIPYFKDQSTGDIQFVHPDIARSSRFNPNRGKAVDMLIAKR